MNENEQDAVSTDRLTVEIILESRSIPFDAQILDVSFDSPAEEILGRLAPAVKEAENIDILDGSGNPLYVVKKMTAQNKIFIYPKGTAGH